MHWYDYNNTIPLLNIVKNLIYIQSGIRIIFKISKFSTILFACQPAIRPGNTSAMAPDFLHSRGNHV